MVDICKCNNKACQIKDRCFRYLAKPSEWQAYGEFSQNDDGTCEHYIEVLTDRECEKLEQFWQ